jgi:hypothetical protein
VLPKTTESWPITVLLTIYESPISDIKNTNDIPGSHVAGTPLLVSPTLEAVPVISLPITLY